MRRQVIALAPPEFHHVPEKVHGQPTDEMRVRAVIPRAARRHRLTPPLWHREEARECRRGRRTPAQAQFPQYYDAFARGIEITTIAAGKAHVPKELLGATSEREREAPSRGNPEAQILCSPEQLARRREAFRMEVEWICAVGQQQAHEGAADVIVDTTHHRGDQRGGGRLGTRCRVDRRAVGQ